MTDREKLYQYFMSYWCEDDPEIRGLYVLYRKLQLAAAAGQTNGAEPDSSIRV